MVRSVANLRTCITRQRSSAGRPPPHRARSTHHRRHVAHPRARNRRYGRAIQRRFCKFVRHAILKVQQFLDAFGLMAIDAFISYSHADKAITDAACARLESAGIRCWIAPRDVPPGSQWAAAIVDAIDHCRVMVLIFSSQANISNQIHREVERAVSKGIPIIPLRIEDVKPTSAMEYFLGSIHWLDALTPPLEKHLQRLSETVKSCLDFNQNGRDGLARYNVAQPAALSPTARSAIQALPEGAQHDASSHQERRAPLHRWPSHRWAVFAAFCLVISASVGAGLYYVKYVQIAKVNSSTEIAMPQVAQQTAAVPIDHQNVTPPVEQQTAPAPLQQPGAANPMDQPSKTTSRPQRVLFNEADIRQLADKQKIPLPPVLAVNAPSPSVPTRFADYLGAWGADQRWGGNGRNGMLIVEDIDESGNATGIYAQGPPNANTTSQAPAAYTAFSAPVTSDGITFTWGLTNTFKLLPGNLMLGHVQGQIAKMHVESKITLQRIPPVEQPIAAAPTDQQIVVSPAKPRSVEK
jgi:TIR domain